MCNHKCDKCIREEITDLKQKIRILERELPATEKEYIYPNIIPLYPTYPMQPYIWSDKVYSDINTFCLSDVKTTTRRL